METLYSDVLVAYEKEILEIRLYTADKYVDCAETIGALPIAVIKETLSRRLLSWIASAQMRLECKTVNTALVDKLLSRRFCEIETEVTDYTVATAPINHTEFHRRLFTTI